MKIVLSSDRISALIKKMAPDAEVSIIDEKYLKNIKKSSPEIDCIFLLYKQSATMSLLDTLPILKRLAAEAPELPVFVLDEIFSLSHHNEVTDFPNVIAYGQTELPVTEKELSNLIDEMKKRDIIAKELSSLPAEKIRKIGWSIHVNSKKDFDYEYADKLFLGEMRVFINNLKGIIDKIRPAKFTPDHTAGKPLRDWLEMWHAHKSGSTHYTDPNTETQKPINISDIDEAKKFFELKKINPSQQHILIRGETGVGKTFIAHFIHNYYYRTCEKNFYKESPTIVSCPELKGNLAVPTLFGCLKGAWTDATTRVGYLLESYNGTLFLDEIGASSPGIQEKLLRYLDHQSFRPDGWSKDGIYVPLLVVAATNQPLEKMIEEGKFREDLYYRFLEIEIPPLRSCMDYFEIYIDCELQNPRTNNGYVDSITIDAIDALKSYSYPGNFREFHRILGRTVEKARDMRVKTIVREHVESAMRQMGVTD